MVTQQKSENGTALRFQILNHDKIRYHSYHLRKDFEWYCWFLAQTIFSSSLSCIHKLNSFSLKQILLREFNFLYSIGELQKFNLFAVIVCSITPQTVSGTMTFGLLSLVRWSWLKGFTIMHLTSRLTSEENRCLKDLLSSWCLLLDSAGMSFQSKQFLNSSITRASSGLHTSHRRRAESSSLLSKSLAPPAPLIILLFCTWIWSNPILKNSRLDFWNEKFPFEK